ncbi:MAG: hypothetical protein M3350_10335 [Actinomycetota bacterium]|nr:hypothetical protein [Actinomycetota bacterium]
MREDPGSLVVEDLRSVRRWLVVLGLIAVVAVGVAAFALLRANDSEEQSADRDRVVVLERQLKQRLAQVDRRLRGTSEESDVDKLERRVRRSGEESDVTKLDRRIRRVESDLVDAVEGAADANQGLGRVARRLDGLSRDVRALRRRR